MIGMGEWMKIELILCYLWLYITENCFRLYKFVKNDYRATRSQPYIIFGLSYKQIKPNSNI